MFDLTQTEGREVRRLIFYVLKFLALLSIPGGKKPRKNPVKVSSSFKKKVGPLTSP
jgi:hypothetical protein